MSESLTTYSPKELAGLLKIPYRVVLRAIMEKKLRCAKFSASTYRIRSEDAAEWMASITK
ncbi:MAG: excisionase family DNA-binding protein [Luteolibacter sp.]